MNERKRHDLFVNALWTIGFLSVGAGLWILSPAWMFIVLGVLLLAVATASALI